MDRLLSAVLRLRQSILRELQVLTYVRHRRHRASGVMLVRRLAHRECRDLIRLARMVHRLLQREASHLLEPLLMRHHLPGVSLLRLRVYQLEKRQRLVLRLRSQDLLSQNSVRSKCLRDPH